ncbi:MAG: hypothetical protein CL908_17490 [Deltaproteobacteria bacterium]|nr:hypothetical protein [Deltaproteobacteria bacterium]
MSGPTEQRPARRLVVFGVTGHLGQELVERLADADWPIADLVGVASAESAGSTFDFRGEPLDVAAEWPVLKGCDLVFICTRGAEALEIVREALRAGVPCIDCTGALVGRTEVPMVVALGAPGEEEEGLAEAPLLALPSSTTLAWAPVLSALVDSVGVSRVVATLLSSASAQGRRGLVSLSEESIALFNQSQPPVPGPAGQAVAFDVIPGGGVDADRVRAELARLFDGAFGLAVATVQVPTFVGEGASLCLELAAPLERAALEARLEAQAGVQVVSEGLGSRGLVAVEEDGVEPFGPTLRDAAGSEAVLVGRIEADPSQPVGQGWRIWLASDPLQLAAEHALRLAARRLGLA